ncbi:hypothetical protein FOA52_010016 [Chlamydomonas sp. UWO 241]|nr:hypothetical protein FOA52_010016 [Chlamydomonas sp. UWO 241]
MGTAPAQPYAHGRRVVVPPRASPSPETPPEASGTSSSSHDSSGSSSSSGPTPSGPVELVQWGGTLPSKRRLLISGTSAAAIALGGNLGGITSFLLGLDGGRIASKSRLDVLVPVLGHKRCVNYVEGFEFTYPEQWLADQTVAVRQAQRAEASRSLDLPSLRSPTTQPRARQVAEPVAAFGPPGSTGEENISVISATIMPGFTLESLGSPDDYAAAFLANIAPEGSGREATLLDARSRTDASDQLYYTLEYIITRTGASPFRRHNISVYTSWEGSLQTFNAQCPEGLWERDGDVLRAAAASYRVLA